MKHWVRIVSEGLGGFGNVQITDAETGAPIHGVRDITINMPMEGATTAEIEVLAEIDVMAEATIRRMRLNTETGEYEDIDEAVEQ